jgi:hypothetical protein
VHNIKAVKKPGAGLTQRCETRITMMQEIHCTYDAFQLIYKGAIHGAYGIDGDIGSRNCYLLHSVQGLINFWI